MKPLRSRFEKDTDKSVQQYTESVSYDKRLYREDIAGSIAHAKMLAERTIITWLEAEQIITGLEEIREELNCGEFECDQALEDIHMNIETRLFEKVGDVAGKLHTARSRNDQVATDTRLFVKDAVLQSVAQLKTLQGTLLDQAESNKKTILPGYTHLQRAQPVTERVGATEVARIGQDLVLIGQARRIEYENISTEALAWLRIQEHRYRLGEDGLTEEANS